MNSLSLNGNWVDLVIIVVVLFFLSEAFRSGFWVIMADFLSFLFSLILAIMSYPWVASLLRSNFSLSHSVSNAIGFLLIAVASEAMIGFILLSSVRNIPLRFWKKSWDKPLAAIPAVGEGLVLMAFILTLVIGLPISPKVKADVADSRVGGYLVSKTTGLEVTVNDVFGEVIEDSLTYLTVQPESRESLEITVGKKQLVDDGVSEVEMYDLINKERVGRDTNKLEWDKSLVLVAREHAKDMWNRTYFGHVSPEGEDVGDRLRGADIFYAFAGENLALAPTLTTAHAGLMNSEGHRENILEKKFRKVGVGVIDNGVYGKMFVQVFTD